MDLTSTLRALSDPTRRSILDLLQTDNVAAGDLAERLTMSRPAISKHLAVLREAGLVAPRRRGRHQIYRLEAGALGELREWLDRHHPTAARPGAVRRERSVPRRGAPELVAQDRPDDWRCW